MTEDEAKAKRTALVPLPDAALMAVDPDWVNRQVQPRGGLLDFWGGAQNVTRVGRAAVVDIAGGLNQRASWFYQGYDEILDAFRAALADQQSEGVLLRINSPGGVCAGCFETARMMREEADAAGKPVVAYVDEMAYSAAYALASAADVIITPKSGGVGSVGVIAAYVDMSKALDMAGVRIAVVASGAHKTDSHPAVPLTDRAIERLRADVSHLAGIFFDQVAERRGMKVEAVKALQAGCFMGQAGVDVGLADRVGTFAEALAEVEMLAREAQKDHTMSKAQNEAAKPADMGEPTITVAAHDKSLSEAVAAEREKSAAALDAVKASLADASKRAEKAEAELAAAHEKIAAHEAARLAAKVDSFVGKKLTPAERDKWHALAVKDESTFDALISDKPDVGALGDRLVPPTGNESRPTDASKADANHKKFLALVADKVKAGVAQNDALSQVIAEHPELGEEGLQMASAIPAAFNHRAPSLTHKFGLKSGDAFVKYQLVQFTSGSSTEVTSVTSANVETCIGIYYGESKTAASGDEGEILLFADGDVFVMINGGTCTAGTKVACEGADGRVTNVGATPASGSVYGVALATSSTDGDWIPVLVSLH